MDWKKLALCMALAGGTVACGGGTEEPTGPGDTRRYVLSAVQIPGPGAGNTAVGFNLDGVVSTGDGSSCVDLSPDYVSINDPGEEGVDNGLAGLVSTIGGLLSDDCPEGTPADQCISALLSEQIAEGSLLLVMEVRGIHSYSNDSDVEMQLYLGSVMGGGAPELEGGMLAPGQDFDLMAVGSAVPGSITSGRMTVQTPQLNIAIDAGGAMLELILRDAEVRANITETTLTNGAIGGSINIEELATAAEEFMPGVGDTVRGAVSALADIDPSDADETECEAISAGIAFTAIDAVDPAPAD